MWSNTFPESMRQGWDSLIKHAFNQWDHATNGLAQMRPVSLDCPLRMKTEGGYQAALEQLVWDPESFLSEIIEGHEGVVFLAPMGSHGNITVEAWQAVAQWDLQEDDDEVVHSVRYGTSVGDLEHTQTLANLKTKVTTSAAQGRNTSGPTQRLQTLS